MRRTRCALAFPMAAVAALHGCASSHGSASGARATVAASSASDASAKASPTDATSAHDEYSPTGVAMRQLPWPPGVVSEIVPMVPAAWQQATVPAFVLDPPSVPSAHVVARGW